MRHRGLKLQITNHKLQIPQRGYMMITLMLVLALITIGLLAVLPEIGQQIRRDREEEMRHRGTAYMRAIQHFYKKFGRYPTRLEDLENTNNIRFLRKRYKDPLNRDPATGKERDFKLLHQTDISFNNGALGQMSGQSLLPGQGGLGGAQGGFGGLQGGIGALGAQPGGLQSTGSAPAQNLASGDSGDTSSGSSSASSSSSGNPDAGENPNSTGSTSSSNSSSGFSGPTFGGGPILGVASTSKAKSIRVFYGKNHYNDWLFIYVSQADRGGLLTGPVNPGGQSGMGGFGGVAPGQAGGVLGQGQGQGLGMNFNQPQNVPAQTPQNSIPTPSPTSPQN